MKDKYNGSWNTAENLFLGKVNEELGLVTIGLVRTPSNIYDGAFLRKNLTLKAVKYFRKNVPS